MEPDALLAKARPYHVTFGRSTLARWVNQGLVTAPERGSRGRGRGRFSEYPDMALAEAVAAAWLFYYERATVPEVRRAREVALASHDLAPILGSPKDRVTLPNLAGFFEDGDFRLAALPEQYPAELDWLAEAVWEGNRESGWSPRQGWSRFYRLVVVWLTAFTAVTEQRELPVDSKVFFARRDDGRYQLTAELSPPE